jgi:signal transduction histidine kinase
VQIRGITAHAQATRLTIVADPAGAQMPPHTVPRVVAGVTAAAATIVAVVTVVGSAREDPASSGVITASPSLLAVGVVALLAVTVSTWATVRDHPQASIGLAVAATGLLVPSWAAFRWLSPDVRAGALAAVPLAIAGTALVCVHWPIDGPPSTLLYATYVLTVGAVAVHVVGYDPFEDPGCVQTCLDVRPAAEALLSTRSAVAWHTALTGTAALLAALAIWRRRPPRVPAVIVGGSLIAFALLASESALRWANWDRQSSSHPLYTLLPACAVATVGVAVLAVTVRTSRTRAAVNHLVTRLSQPEITPDNPHGPIRSVHFAVPGESRWVDAHGQPVSDVPAPNLLVPISDQSDGPVFRFVLSRPRDSAELLQGITPAARLALHNAQLSALTRARLADVTASRRRIVATADAERRQIERDVHDGAQQRLVSAAFFLSFARSRLPTASEPLGHVEELLHDALSQLRLLTHGVFPRVLATEGLRAAVEDLIADADIAVTLEVRGTCEVPDDIAIAAYATVANALHQATRRSLVSPVRVSIMRRDDTLHVAVTTTGDAATNDVSLFTDLADRVGALGGQLLVSSDDTITTLTSVLPCVSS